MKLKCIAMLNALMISTLCHSLRFDVFVSMGTFLRMLIVVAVTSPSLVVSGLCVCVCVSPEQP